MSYEPYTCIDCGSEYCPCHLAEAGKCILCTHLDGKDFCDCYNWNGVCIYQEFVQNGYKAKEGRKYLKCTVDDVHMFEEKIILIKVKVTDKLLSDLTKPGSFVFIRRPESPQVFDTPICVMSRDGENNVITLAVEIKGLKTKAFKDLKAGDEIMVKGPFWNGILGLKSIMECKNSSCLLVSRGIGQAPMVPVMEKLKNNNNKVIVILDKEPLMNSFIKDELSKYADEIIECSTIGNGGVLKEEFRNALWQVMYSNDISLVHSDGADILNYQVMKIVEAVNGKIKFSCSNNEKMCCGEGVCGCCTLTNNDEKLRRLCKMQTEPKYVFEGRRLF